LPTVGVAAKTPVEQPITANVNKALDKWFDIERIKNS